MQSRIDSLPLPLEVRAFYSIPALARAANVTTYTLRRLFLANHIRVMHSGRAVFVPLSEIQRKIPSLWGSLRAAEALRLEALKEARRARGRRPPPRPR
jgi:hypothetical protein